MSTSPVTLDLSTAQPIQAPVKLDMSTAQPIGGTQSETKKTWIDSAMEGAGEFWKQVNPISALKGLSQAAQHPIETGKSLLEGQGELAVKAKDAFQKGDYAAGVQHVLNYLVPIIGQQTDQAGDLLRSGQYAKGAGMTAGIAANIAAPELIKGVSAKLPVGQLPERLYQSALKPSTTLPTGQVKSLINTGLENQIPVSAEGAQKLSGLISDLNNQVQGKIQAGAQAGATVDKFKVASRLGDTAQKFATQVTPESDLNAVSQAGNEFLRNQPGQIPVDQAQALKSGTYQQLKAKAYGEVGSASTEAQKALARGIKEELEQQFPEIKGLNAVEGKMINLDGVLDRAVRRIDNHQLFGIGTPVMMGAGATVAGGPGAAAGALMKIILDNPEMKSKLAIALNRASKGQLTMPAATARVVGYSNALGNALPSDSQSQSAP